MCTLVCPGCLPVQVYKIGKKGEESHNAGTDFDVSSKEITPMGGFPHYGVVKEDYLMIKGAVPGEQGCSIRVSAQHQRMCGCAISGL